MAGFLRGLALGAGKARAGQLAGRTQAEILLARRRVEQQERDDRQTDRKDRQTEAVLRHSIERERTDIARQGLAHDETRAKADLLRAQASGMPDPDKRNVSGERWDAYRSAFRRAIAAKKSTAEAQRLAQAESGYSPSLLEMEAMMMAAGKR